MHGNTVLFIGLVLCLGACGGSDSTPADNGHTSTSGPGSDAGLGENASSADESPSTDTLDTTPPNDVISEPVSTSDELNGVTEALYSHFAFITVYSEDPVSMEAIFYEAETALPLSEQMPQIFRPMLDNCNVGFAEINEPTPIPRPDFTVSTRNVSAGDVLTVSSPAGSYAELLRQGPSDEVSYQMPANVVLSPPLPDGLVMSAPGDEFPGFSNLALPTTGMVDLLSPRLTELITVDTEFSWIPSGDPDTFLIITTYNPDISPATLNDLRLTMCFARDDGTFEFPDATQAAMGESFAGLAFYSRVTQKMVETADSFLFIQGVSRGVL